MQEENKPEIVELEEAKSSVLDRTRKAMRKAKKRILFSKICSISIPIIVAILLIGYPIIMHNINAGRETTKSWENLIEQVKVNYTDLEKTSIVSIEELNKTKEAQFYWLENMTRTESYILTYKGKNTLIEEHYLYEDIECVLYVTHKNSILYDMVFENISLENQIKVKENIKIDYNFLDNVFYGEMFKNFNYYFEFKTEDNTTIETILSNLTNS